MDFSVRRIFFAGWDIQPKSHLWHTTVFPIRALFQSYFLFKTIEELFKKSEALVNQSWTKNKFEKLVQKNRIFPHRLPYLHDIYHLLCDRWGVKIPRALRVSGCVFRWRLGAPRRSYSSTSKRITNQKYNHENYDMFYCKFIGCISDW